MSKEKKLFDMDLDVVELEEQKSYKKITRVYDQDIKGVQRDISTMKQDIEDTQQDIEDTQDDVSTIIEDIDDMKFLIKRILQVLPDDDREKILHKFQKYKKSKRK